MPDIDCLTKKWGSSIGIIIPNDIVKKEHIIPNERIRITVTKIPDAKSIWDIGPIQRKQTTQQIKDELRKGW
jgi:antitoxin component of MazEF toxin-antitoxin module